MSKQATAEDDPAWLIIENGEFQSRDRSGVGLLFLESVLYFNWPGQPSSGTIRILGKGLN